MEAGGLTVRDLVDDFARSLKAQRKAPKTIRAYSDAARKFATWAENTGNPATAAAVERRHVEAFIVDQLEQCTPATAAAYCRHLPQFWRWVVVEGETDVSPMAGMSPPMLPEAARPGVHTRRAPRPAAGR
jgi:site-specific recombinase XerC